MKWSSVKKNFGVMGPHWFLCALYCFQRLSCFTILVWDPMSSFSLMRPSLKGLKAPQLATKQEALGFHVDGWSCT